jgi:hypothetical protein
MNDATAKKIGIAFDSALVILLLTAAAYLVAFGFDVGYLSYFGLPMILAEASLRGLLFCAGAGAWLGFLLIVADTFVTLLPFNVPPVVWRKLSVLTVVVLAICTYVWLEELPWVDLAVLSVLPIWFVCSEMLWPLFVYRSKATYEAKLLAVEESRKRKDKGIVARLRRANLEIAGRHVAVLLVFLTVIAFAPAVGVYIARTQDTFAMSLGSNPCLVLRVRQDGVLCASVDLQRHLVTGSFEIFSSVGAKIQMVETGHINKFDFKPVGVSVVPLPVQPPLTPKSTSSKQQTESPPAVREPAQPTSKP